jgi:hypothetical protein
MLSYIAAVVAVVAYHHCLHEKMKMKKVHK